MMNSLSLGVWGSFSTPRSRALGGKSGMTRAAPLVCFAFARLPHAFAALLAERPRLLLLLLIGLIPWSAWVAALPPNGQPALLAPPYERACLGDPFDHFSDPINWIEKPWCALAEHSHTRGGTRRVSVRSQRAPPR